MLGEKIKQFRQENNLTQKELADKVFVTAQAVSRWEKNEVEPSLATLNELAKIFEVQISEFFDEPEVPEKKQEVEKEVVYTQPQPVLAVCEQCNQPIYKSSDIRRVGYGDEKKVLCSKCDDKNRINQHNKEVAVGIKQRKKSFIWGSIFAGLALLVFIYVLTGDSKMSKGDIIFGGISLIIQAFTFSSCLFLRNNFIEEVYSTIVGWGYVTFPGLIWEFSIDGFLWLISVKLLFWILGFIISTFMAILATMIAAFLSVFTYPFALAISYRHPENSYDYDD